MPRGSFGGTSRGAGLLPPRAPRPDLCYVRDDGGRIIAVIDPRTRLRQELRMR